MRKIFLVAVFALVSVSAHAATRSLTAIASNEPTTAVERPMQATAPGSQPETVVRPAPVQPNSASTVQTETPAPTPTQAAASKRSKKKMSTEQRIRFELRRAGVDIDW